MVRWRCSGFALIGGRGGAGVEGRCVKEQGGGGRGAPVFQPSGAPWMRSSAAGGFPGRAPSMDVVVELIRSVGTDDFLTHAGRVLPLMRVLGSVRLQLQS